MRDESEKEVVHRLEAFSDIVIGFGLAQLSLSLTIPKHVRDLFEHSHGLSTLGAFVVTFALVCSLWWMHHRLFRHLFVPTKLNIVLNFAALGGILFLAYAMQVIVHVTFHDRYAMPLYTGSYGYVAALFAVLSWYGFRTRGQALPESVRAQSFDSTVRLTILAGVFILATIAAVFVEPGDSFLYVLMLLVALPMLLQRALRRLRHAGSPSA